ncbi:redoxin domain-containing protein [Capnocytophaga canis]|uniref:redoxin domain-containing protein n=1 Tax=Capnocytophaga canis TaxID=1848903 RepID=UPI00370DDF4D
MNNKHKILLVSILGSIFSCNNTMKQESDSFTLNGKLPTNVNEKVYLLEYKNREYTVVDSVEAKNQTFTFKGKLQEPLVHAIRLGNSGKRANFFLENADISITLNDNWQISEAFGSENTELFKKYDDLNATKRINLDSLLQKDNSSPVIAYFLARNAYLYDYESLILLRKRINQNLSRNTYIEELDGAIAQLEKIQPGQVAPEIVMEDLEGNTICLSDLRGKVVLIDFWASWCPDCRKENPELVKLYNQYKDKNFTILGVSFDRKKDDWKTAIATDGLTWTHGFVEGAWKAEPIKTYAIRWLPTAMLIDKNGIIVARNIDHKKLIPNLENLLK